MWLNKAGKVILLITFIVLFVSVFLPSTTHAACYNSTQNNVPNALVDGDIDHYDLECFENIPDSWISAAASQRLLFIDRSVGGNISDALNCLGTGDSYLDASSACTKEISESEYVSDTKYDRRNWHFAHYGDGGWNGNLANFILNQGLTTVNEENQRVPFSPNYNSYDVFNFQFSYLSVAEGSNIVGDTGYFVPFPGSTNSIRDVHDMEEFERNYPNATFIQATTSLARSIGGQTSNEFNNQMRNYSRTNNVPLIDFADIGSHDPNGNVCRDSSGYPVLCQVYTSERVGGHLSNSIGKQRVAKAMWLAMVGQAGWVPNTSTTPPPASPTPTRTITPTSTPRPSTTVAPTPTPILGDGDGDGDVDGTDFSYWLRNFGSNTENGPRDGDFDSDRDVDGTDFSYWLRNFGIGT